MAVAASIGLASVTGPAQAAGEQYLPLLTYRVGPYASSGIPVWAGFRDYLTYINEAEGGINGVKIVFDECETGWLAEKGVECYERVKGGLNGAPAALWVSRLALSAGIRKPLAY